ncbi:putative protein kinase [Trypanosoma cruzi]|uniref:Protein kinase domain-containing protein n=1 Tax=Trypanosoma cruzi TaxID=5693 RepID=A0A2V2UFS5_TRYCR|nr:putative protein kinase [Trypanosoma cruzi]
MEGRGGEEKKRRERWSLDMDRFIVGSPIGEGRFGVVRAAVVKESGVPAAIKFITTPRLDEGIPHPTARELLVAMRLVHPFVIRTYEVVPCGCSLALVMERCKTDLVTVLSGRTASNPLPALEANSLFKMLLLALAYIHSEGVLHRDVKPSNCFLTAEGGNTPRQLWTKSCMGYGSIHDSRSRFEVVPGSRVTSGPAILRTRN